MDMEDRIHINGRLTDLEWNVKKLLSHTGLSWDTAPMDTALGPAVVQALQAGNMIKAIKLHREATGLGLAEAKAAVEGFVQ